ncbi:toll/interleukin-1 receptor domain-containing protein [Spirillospora sp. NPDC047279]|uniref:toll/interleukin-1 receptor domain-containing protein n=1 Tax=Spirillospora sp. NPDC047279 TaxID=3155478 RepID=UPI0033CC5BA2
MFVSYAQHEGHSQVVRDFWEFLRSNDIDARLDLSAAARRQDWALWMGEQIREADVVLCVASKLYRERAEGRTGPDAGRGVQWEARLIRDAFYAGQDDLQRFVPVVLETDHGGVGGRPLSDDGEPPAEHLRLRLARELIRRAPATFTRSLDAAVQIVGPAGGQIRLAGRRHPPALGRMVSRFQRDRCWAQAGYGPRFPAVRLWCRSTVPR